MANLYFLGTATAVKQVSTVQITAVDATPANNTFIITIGGVQVSVVGNTDVNTTASDLQVALEASTHPYFSNVDWTVSTDTVTGTAGTAGVPFVATSSKTGAGSGTIGAVATPTANAGPNDLSTVGNYSTGALPTPNDILYIADIDVNICWGLDALNALDSNGIKILQTYTGKIGLDYTVFATSADGETTLSTVQEYRDTYMQVDMSVAAKAVEIGQSFGTGNPVGSQRIMIDMGDNAGTVLVHNTHKTSSEVGRPVVRLKANNASTDIHVKLAPGGLGIAIDKPDETSVVGDINISDTTTVTRVKLGDGVTLTNWVQAGGVNILRAAATVTKITGTGGTLETQGDFTVTTANNGLVKNGAGMTFIPNHIKTSGNAITALNQLAGLTDGTQSTRGRTWATVELKGGELEADEDYVTITDLKPPTAGEGPYSLKVA